MYYLALAYYILMAVLVWRLVYTSETLRTVSPGHRWFVSVFEGLFWIPFIFNLAINLIQVSREEK